VNQRQKLHDTIDVAADTGACDLPVAGVRPKSDAVANAMLNDPRAPTQLAKGIKFIQLPP
jgi:hypothetical protein